MVVLLSLLRMGSAVPPTDLQNPLSAPGLSVVLSAGAMGCSGSTSPLFPGLGSSMCWSRAESCHRAHCAPTLCRMVLELIRSSAQRFPGFGAGSF